MGGIKKLEANEESKNEQKCVVCKNLINMGAKKCIQCDSWQDYRQFLNIGNTSISLIIAVLSVFALASDGIIKILEYTRDKNLSEVIGHVMELEEDYLTMFVKNIGPSQAVLSSEVFCNFSSHDKKTDLTKIETVYYAAKQSENLILNSNESTKIRLKHTKTTISELKFSKDSGKEDCILPFKHANGKMDALGNTLHPLMANRFSINKNIKKMNNYSED